jgi:hypothetical protein
MAVLASDMHWGKCASEIEMMPVWKYSRLGFGVWVVLTNLLLANARSKGNIQLNLSLLHKQLSTTVRFA